MKTDGEKMEEVMRKVVPIGSEIKRGNIGVFEGVAQILRTEGVEISSDDQSLPTNDEFWTMTESEREAWRKGANAMKKAGFKKVIKGVRE